MVQFRKFLSYMNPLEIRDPNKRVSSIAGYALLILGGAFAYPTYKDENEVGLRVIGLTTLVGVYSIFRGYLQRRRERKDEITNVL